jgi:SpoVK/Ycf46/Vps4 family AAA+-type ATPase
VATTNFPQNLISSLADRPGRFDQLIELLPPTAEERVQLYEFFVRRPATEKEISILKGTKGKKLSIAHIKEIPIRMAIHDKDIDAVVSEMNAHTEKVKKQFSKTERMGFGD